MKKVVMTGVVFGLLNSVQAMDRLPYALAVKKDAASETLGQSQVEIAEDLSLDIAIIKEYEQELSKLRARKRELKRAIKENGRELSKERSRFSSVVYDDCAEDQPLLDEELTAVEKTIEELKRVVEEFKKKIERAKK